MVTSRRQRMNEQAQKASAVQDVTATGTLTGHDAAGSGAASSLAAAPSNQPGAQVAAAAIVVDAPARNAGGQRMATRPASMKGSGASGGGGLSGGGSSEVKLEELSKYFHLPEKSVAKELGICLTSLKKLCRSYGITRWPFRKLKSLERTMKKVQTEEEAVSSQAAGEGGGSDVRRKPYTVGNKTVFLSDEELDVFKMTMGKQATHELKPASLETLEPSLFNQELIASAGKALAAVSRGNNVEPDDESRVSAEVINCTLIVTNWSTLWSQPQLKGRLLEPLEGVAMRVSSDGVTAELDFMNQATAQRALRITRMAETQAMQTHVGAHNNGTGVTFAAPTGPGSRAGQHAPRQPPTSNGLGGSSPPLTFNILSDSAVQPPSTSVAQSMWASFLGPATSLGQLQGGATGSSAGGKHASDIEHGVSRHGAPVGSSAGGGGSIVGYIPSPPLSETTGAGPLSLGGHISSLFPGLFGAPHSLSSREHQGTTPTPPTSNNRLLSPPLSSHSLSNLLDDGGTPGRQQGTSRGKGDDLGHHQSKASPKASPGKTLEQPSSTLSQSKVTLEQPSSTLSQSKVTLEQPSSTASRASRRLSSKKEQE